jgi:hypothetical protein
MLHSVLVTPLFCRREVSWGSRTAGRDQDHAFHYFDASAFLFSIASLWPDLLVADVLFLFVGTLITGTQHRLTKACGVWYA